MSSDSGRGKKRDTTRVFLEPPAFTPSAEMRESYLERHKGELSVLLDSARSGEWKPVMASINNVRGTGAMYGFANIGDAAEKVAAAVQNADLKCLEYLEEYVAVVRDARVQET